MKTVQITFLNFKHSSSLPSSSRSLPSLKTTSKIWPTWKEFDPINLGNVTNPPCVETKDKMPHLWHKRWPITSLCIPDNRWVLLLLLQPHTSKNWLCRGEDKFMFSSHKLVSCKPATCLAVHFRLMGNPCKFQRETKLLSRSFSAECWKWIA